MEGSFTSNGGYRANAFSPETGAKNNPGRLVITGEDVRFESATVSGRIPLAGLRIRRGGHNEEQLFFEHPSFAGWSIYSSDPELLHDPILSQHPDFSRQLKTAAKSRNSVPKPVLIGLAFLAILFGGLLLLWTQKDRLADAVAARIPKNWEVSFGNRIFDQIRAEGRVLTNSGWEQPLAKITTRLVSVVEKSGYAFHFHIMEDTNVNAFAIPGGHVVILTGLLEKAETAEELPAFSRTSWHM
jgi:beta-barrel assembly-enhancing protease